MSHTSSRDDVDAELWRVGVHHDPLSTRTYGFWLFMMSDALLFSGLFAAYGVLDHPQNTFGGPGPHDIAQTLTGFWQTLALLTSVGALSVGMVAFKHRNRLGTSAGILLAVLSCGGFLGLETHQLLHLAQTGGSPDRSGFLACYFVLLGTHGLHLVVGVLWMLMLLVQLWSVKLDEQLVGRMLNLRMFWQFQASIWICIYAFVTLRGAF